MSFMHMDFRFSPMLLMAVIAISLSFSSARAQTYTYEPPMDSPEDRLSPWEFGFFIAPQMGWMQPTSNKSKDKSFEVDRRGGHLGFAWGIMLDYRFGENVGLSSGLEISQSGGGVEAKRVPGTAQGGGPYVREARFDYRLQYLHLPLALKLRSDPFRKGLRVFGEMGLGLGFNLSKKADYEVLSIHPSQQEIVSTGRREKLSGGTTITPILLSMQIGAGVELPVSSTFILHTGLYFVNGFTPDLTNPRKYSLDYLGDFDDGKIRMNRMALRIGLKF